MCAASSSSAASSSEMAWVLRAALVLVPLRCVGVALNGIADCDEVFNYWEALHLMIAGSSDHRVALQTWEYAPNYALRSWAFLFPYSVVARLHDALTGDAASAATYLAVRGFCLAAPFALAESWFVGGVALKFGGRTALSVLCLLAASPGCFAASTQLLPSSVALCLVFFSHGCWLRGSWRSATCLAVLATVWPGWPFVAALFIPFALETLWARSFKEVVVVGACAGLFVLAPVALYDAQVYGSRMSPLWNLWKYNATGGGDELYGVAPASYYIKNLLLNAPVPTLLLILTPVLFLRRSKVPPAVTLTQLAPALVWFGILFSRPHKEERFLFPAYASLHLGGGLILESAVLLTERLVGRGRLLRLSALTAALLLGASRITAVTTNYATPQNAVWSIAAEEAALRPHLVTVCVGAEWYRYTSTFNLPTNARLGFVKSEFTGELPRHWEAADSWRLAAGADVADHFNDGNQEEAGRYLHPASCDYAVDYDGETPSALATALASDSGAEWVEVRGFPFLDAARTPALARALQIPFYSRKRQVFARLLLLRRTPA